ncbi:hypothetical protein KDL45_13600 [bacterium]|nr:hypothetical protein [bacterium]
MKPWTTWTMCVGAVLLTVLIGFGAAACGGDDGDGFDASDDGAAGRGSGELTFYVSGEDLVTDGFMSKDEWWIRFDHFWVNIAEFTAYQEPIETKHMGHPHEDIPTDAAHETVPVTQMLDLAAEGRLMLSRVEDAPAGNYNFVNFTLAPSPDGDLAGYSMVMTGSAQKNGRVVEFAIPVSTQLKYVDCEHRETDPYAGVVEPGGEGEVEITLHVDHLFGNAQHTEHAHVVNNLALGFEPFAEYAAENGYVIDMAPVEEILDADDYAAFIEALREAGHSGEGHCSVDSD